MSILQQQRDTCTDTQSERKDSVPQHSTHHNNSCWARRWQSWFGSQGAPTETTRSIPWDVGPLHRARRTNSQSLSDSLNLLPHPFAPWVYGRAKLFLGIRLLHEFYITRGSTPYSGLEFDSRVPDCLNFPPSNFRVHLMQALVWQAWVGWQPKQLNKSNENRLVCVYSNNTKVNYTPVF